MIKGLLTQAFKISYCAGLFICTITHFYIYEATAQNAANEDNTAAYQELSENMLSDSPRFAEENRDYKDKIQRLIKRKWFPCKDLGGTVVSFTLDRSSQISDLKVLTSCGVAECDKRSLDAVQMAAPKFPSIPKSLPDKLTAIFDFGFIGLGKNFKQGGLHLYRYPGPKFFHRVFR